MQSSPARGLSRRAGFLLAQLGTHAHRQLAERLARLGLHPRHFGMLSHLAAAEGQSQQALSIALGIHRSAVVALVDDLEQRGLAERRRDPVDRRAYTLYLTLRGARLLADLERIVDEHDVELLTALNASQRSQLISLLQRVAESQGLDGGRSSKPRAARRRQSHRPERGRDDPPADSAKVPLKDPYRNRQLPMVWQTRANPAGLSPRTRSGLPIQASAQC